MEYPQKAPALRKDGKMRAGATQTLGQWSADAREYLSQLAGVKRTSPAGTMPETFNCGCVIAAFGGTICQRHWKAMDAGD